MDKLDLPIKVTTIALPAPLHKRLRFAALADERPAIELVREAIEEYLDRREKRDKGRAGR